MEAKALTKQSWGLVLLFQMLIGWAAPAMSGERHEVPLRFYGTRPAVELLVNGKGPFLFLVDTGAGGPSARADMSLVKQLSITQEGRSETADAGGAAATVDLVSLDTVRVAGVTFPRVPALSRDYGTQSYLPKIDGILGLNFFKDWLLTIDYPRAKLIIEKGELPKADGRSVLAYELIDGNAYIPAMIGKKPMKLLLDTGNIRALDLPSAWLQPLRLVSFPRLAGNSTSVSGTTAIREVKLADPLIIGMYKLPKPSVTFSDDFEEANIGSSILQEFAVTLDQRNRRVRLVRR